MSQELLNSIQEKPFYALIQRRYQGKIARRSGVSYMNHIREEVLLLYSMYGDDAELIEAYCLHPIFQSDKSLSNLLVEGQAELALLSPRIIILAMEYRRVANSYTIRHKIKAPTSIDIGPLTKVHQMLVADKIQNKKDFMKYMYLKHDRPSYRKVSEHGLQYFDSWLNRLGVSPKVYEAAITLLEQDDGDELNR